MYGQAIGSLNVNATAEIKARKSATLLGAISSVNDLNKRLYDVLAQARQIAQAVGGPYPAAGPTAANSTETAEPPAMVRLDVGIGLAHSAVSDIESALSALNRTLGS